jgi:hypothetical protein
MYGCLMRGEPGAPASKSSRAAYFVPPAPPSTTVSETPGPAAGTHGAKEPLSNPPLAMAKEVFAHAGAVALGVAVPTTKSARGQFGGT